MRVHRSPHFKAGLLQRTAAQMQQVHSGPERFRHHDSLMRVIKVTDKSNLWLQSSRKRNSWPSLIANGSRDEDAVAGIFRNIQPYSNLA